MKAMKNLAYGIVGLAAFTATSAFAAGTLPTGYTEIEYIQGNGANARIVTDYTPQPNTDKIEAVVEWPANTLTANQAVWCARGNGLQVDSWTLFYLNDNKKFRLDYGPNGNFTSLTPDFTAATGTKYTITAEDGAITYSANGTVLQSHSTTSYSFTPGSVLALFASHYNGINSGVGNYGKQKLYSFKVWRSSKLIHYFVPCKDSGGAATLVDICDNPATLTKSGTFTAGTVGHYYDDALFTIPDDTLLIVGTPSDYCTPSPAYGTQTNLVAGATFTVSCGATVVTNGSTECIYQGWKLCDATGNVISNGTETSFTYAHPTPAKGRKLVWQWKTRPVGADATDLLPTLCMTFNGQSLANTGTGTLTMKDKGTPTYVPSVDGYALNASAYTPWGDNVSNVITANRDSSIAVVAALGTTSCGILVCFRNSSNNAGIILRRGTTANQVVLTQGNSTTALITVNDIENADTEYHLYVMNILSSGVELYVDGEHVGTTTSTPRANAMNSMQIGSRHGNVISPEAIYGGGLIDDLRVYASALDTEQMKALGESIGVISPLSILQIPVQFCLRGETPEPGFTVTNTETGASWDYGEGGVASGQTPFDVAYSFTNGYGTVTLTGKAGSEYEGKTVKRNYKLTHDLIVNGDFESGAWAPGWTASGNYAKIETSSSAYGPNQSTTFISGAYCAILQKQNVASQVFTNDSQYCAELSWKCKQRGGYSDIPYEVMLDGERIFYEYFPTGTSEVHYRTVENIVLQPGEHTLTFHTITTADRTLFLDNVSLEVVSKTYLEILPIPNQSCATGPCRPEFVVSNLVEGQSWRIGGDIVSSDFDVAYSNNDVFGTATVTATGKGDYEGEVLSRTFAITEDENVSTTAASSYRLLVGDNLVYVFTNAASEQTITARKNLFLADALLVGGGGAGGINFGGGGGGGGVVALDGVNFSLAPGESLEFSVGAGGKPSTSTAAGNSRYGGNSSISIGDRFYFAKGGGGGGNVNQTAGLSGGSGGGGTKGANGGAGTAGQGYAGAKAGSNSRSGGGGGAGHAGYEYTTEGGNRAGNGGEGVTNDITGVWVYYGGGGGGGGSANGNDLFDPGYGGLGGGGNGGKSVEGDAGVDGLGGGGGGGGYIGDRLGGNGGSGTVILAFKICGFDIDPIETQFLAPGGCFPEPVVRVGGTLLVKDSDYTVAYSDNDATGLATITVTGIGTYAGKVGYASFTIATRYFLKPAVAAEGDGSSWADAMSVTNFFATCGVISNRCEVWIAAGTVPAAALTATVNAPFVVRGGFAGTETTLAERPAGTLTVFDGKVGNTRTSSILLSVDNATYADLLLERIKFCNAKSNGFVKTGGGSLKLLDCVVEANGRDVGKSYGRGMNVQSDGYGSLVVSNCVFAGNRNVTQGDNYGGFGIYIDNFKNALVDRSLFVTNGFDILTPEGTVEGHWGWCGTNAKGSSIYANNTPITVSNCRFAGNNCPLNAGTGGVVYLAGASGGSVIDHCTFIGNSEHLSYQAQGSGLFGGAGALVVNLVNATDKVSVDHCTFAYNLTGAGYSAGGISVVKGDVDIENSIFWKNIRYNTTTIGYGLDVHVSSSGTANIRHSTVTDLDGTALGGAGLTYDPQTVFAADPKLVTTTEAFTNLLKVTSSRVYYNPNNATRYEDLASMDAHLLSPTGYVDNAGVFHDGGSAYSPAIDAGDPEADCSNEPEPNGGRLNAGAFGNTAEASSSATGQPEANVEVLYLNDEPRPVIRITMGLESGDAYNAMVRLNCSVDGMPVVDEMIFYGVGNGAIIEQKLPLYLPVGTECQASVTITAAGAEIRYYDVSEPATGTPPPFFGKGGGASVIHVRTGADCKMDGTSWTDAYPDLVTALASVPDETITEVWLAVTNDFMNRTVTLGYPLTIRGGFTGVENSPAERPEGHRANINGNYVYTTMSFEVPEGALLEVERIHFLKASQNELRKTGKGDLLVRDCIFAEHWSDSRISGRGIYASGGGTVAVTNCTFARLGGPTELSNTTDGGDAIYLSSCARAYIDNCLFVTNGAPFSVPLSPWGRHKAASIYASSTPTIISNCRFAACCAAQRHSTDGGIVCFTGKSGGSKMVNCALVGNGDFLSYNGGNAGASGGAIACEMSATNLTLDVENCTIAYNLTDGYKSAAGINVYSGTVNLKNSIVYGNVRGRSDYALAGSDIDVKSNATLNISYTLVTGTTSNYVGNVLGGGNINWGPGVITSDPLFLMTTNDFVSLLATASNIKYIPSSVSPTVAAIDVHPRTRTGYIKDGVLIRDPERVESPTIDKGDPTSDYSKEPQLIGIGGNGGRVNLGFSGNTPEAALTRRTGSVYYLR